MALRVGLEPTTYRLTADCSTIELPEIIQVRMVAVTRFELMTHRV